MALPAPLLTGLLPSEVEYLSVSTTTLRIVPLLRIDRVRLLSGVYGPFRPPHQVEVPLWLALNLKARRKAVVVPPEWLGVESLKSLLQRESANLEFAPVPLHYVAIAKVLLDVAPDDIPSADEVRALLKDLREARQSKVLKGLVALNSMHISMSNISMTEICELRPFFVEAFEHLRALGPRSSTSTASQVGAGNLSAYDDSQMTLESQEGEMAYRPLGGAGASGGGGGGTRRGTRVGDTTVMSDSGYVSGVGAGAMGRVADDSFLSNATEPEEAQGQGQGQGRGQQQQAAGFDSMDLF